MSVAPQFQRYLDSSYNNLEIDLDEIEIADPPRDDSHTTRMELEELDSIVQEAKLPREIMRVADRDPLRLFYSVAKKKGLDPLEEEAKLWADDWTKLSFEFKLKFKRRRPYEVKKEHDVDFAHHKTDTTESPSYPSGHAMMAYGVAEFYKDKYPLMAGEWDNVADIISHSRLQMGVHYPSDVEASKSIVRQVAEQTKEASYARLARTVTQKRKLPIGRFKRKPTAAPAPAPAPAAAPTPQTWGQKAKGWASQNPTQATAAVGATGLGGYMWVKKSAQPKPQPMGMPKMGSLGHLEQRRSERAKFMSKEELLKLEKQVRNTKGLPDGSHYITLPHGRKGVVRTEEGRSHLATILDARMRPPGRDLTKLVKSSSGHSKEARALFSRLANMARTTPTGTALEIYGRQAGKGLRRGAHRGLQKGTQAARGVYTSPKLFDASYFVQKHLKPEMADDIGGVVNLFKGGSVKTAAEKLRLYHGSPLDLETLEPRQPNKGRWGESGLYGTPNQLVAALYAIARNDSRGSWGILPDGRLIAKSKKELNPEGYVYEYDSDDYIPPPEDDPGIGYATQSSPEILSKEKVYLDNLRDSITRVDDRDKFLEYFKKTSSPRLRTTIFGVDPDGNLLHGFGGQGFYKFPGGGVDPGESIVDAAKRELLEEAGYEVDSIEELPGLDTSDSVGATSAKGHMGHGSSLTKYLLARLGKRNESLLGSEGDAISNLQTAPIDEVLGGLEGDMLFGSGVAESNHAALSRVRDMLQKTSAYKDYRPRGTLYLLDGKGGVMADKPTADYNSTTPYFFPGGGIFEEEKVDRLPTHDEIVGGVEREALEELGTKLKNVRVLQDEPANVDMPDWWRERQKKKRGVDYKGIAEFFAAAERGDQDKSIYGADNDEFKGTFYPIDEVASALEANAQPGDDYYEDSMRQARLLRSLLEKTSSDQPLLRHRSTLLIRDPETGKLLAGKEPPNSKASPFYFPGGGLYDDEYDTPRNPTEEEIIEGARREALEELGIHLDNPRVVGSYAQELEDWWKEKTLKNRGVPYVGGHEHYVLADKGKENRSLYNVEGDAFEQGDYYDPKEIVEALSRVAKGDSTFAPFNREQVRAIKDNLLTKTSSIDLLTGRMGAGKSTLLNKLRDQYDIVEGTDLGSVVDGKFVEPSDEDKPRLRQEKADRLLAAHKAGKRVLMEGYPPGLFRIPGMVEAADRAVILEPDLLQRLMQIGNRSKERGTSIEEDIRFAVSPEHSAKEQKYLDMLRESITGTHIAPTSEAAEEYLLKKNASDLSVLTAVPKQNLDLIMRKGLYSQKAMLDDPEVMAAFLAQRNADKAWKNDEQYDEKRFREQYDKRVALMEGDDAPLAGPSVFFTDPDPDKVSDPRHFVNKFDTQKLRINLGKLLADIPETRITGAELIPSSAAENMSDEEFEQYVKDRRRDITPEEAAKYIATDPKELWKHYKDEYLGRYYAADVPHAFIRTPSGIIPPEYLEPVEKTSSEQPLLRHRATLLIRDPDTGKLLVADNTGDPRFTDISPFSFPGGGVYHDEYHTPRTPTEEDIIEGARREALEELGIGLANPRVIGSSEVLLPEYKQKAIKNRRAPYEGKHEHYVLADKGPADSSLYNSEGDAFTRGQYVDPKTIYESLIQFSKGLNSHAPLNAGQAKAIKDHLLSKTSSAKEQLKHILVTGHSGAGKTTYSRQLAEELGIPLHRLDVTTGPIMEAEYPEYWDKGTLGYPEDVSTRVIQQALNLDKPHVIEGSHILEIPELTEGYKRILIDTPEDRVVEQRAQREYRNQGRKGKPYRPIEKHREAAKELVNHYRDIVTKFRNQPGVESIVPEVKQAALEDEFQPDLTPDDLKALGVYDQVYGDAPSEASMKEWPEHWINPQDPLGWLQWYDRYSGGRRTEDDARQIKRWKSFKARHLAQYLKKPTPRRAAALRNWGIDVEKY